MNNKAGMGKTKSHAIPAIDPRFLLSLRGIFILSFILIGLYYELAAAVISICLLTLLLWQGRKGKLTVHVNDALIAVIAVSLFYFLTCIWATDRGMALWGGVKYLPIILFGLCLAQLSVDQRRTILADIPWLGGCMTLVSFALQFIPALSGIFTVSGRLAGFFQYPNTYACFLLLGLEILLLDRREYQHRWLRPLCGSVLLFGLLQAGSRTIFILTVPALLICLILRRNRRMTVAAVISLVCGGGLSMIFSWLSGIGGTGRILEISASASTFLGRLLYWKDALPIILRHPFGLGYLGYYFTQGSFQTGVYTVRWVHNDLLQLLLDVGWIPVILAVFAIVRALSSKRSNAMTRIVLLTLLAHCMTDFDLEFVAMYFVLLLCLDWDELKVCRFKISAIPGIAVAAVAGVLSLYIGVTSTLTYTGHDRAAAAIYPWNTLSELTLLTETEDLSELDSLADRILARNSYAALAWDAKALTAYSQGDFGSMIIDKRQAISLSVYDLEEYTDYFDKLCVGYELYLDEGYPDSAEICLEEIRSLQTTLDALAEKTDSLAWQLDDQPELTMPDTYFAFLQDVDNTD